jgi:Cu-processing system ATP-binding protein
MISYRAFTKDYGAHRAIDALTLDVERGSVVALLGPNGSGKTTSLKAAAGLVTPTSGEVLVGDPLRPARDPAARQCLSYLPQRVAFPESLTGREIVEFYRRLRGGAPPRTTEALRLVALNGASDRPTGSYSGGMAQRLGLAVAVVADAPVLLLDEPTASLDPDGLCAFYGVVDRRRREGHTLLFTSHQLGDVERLADRFAVLVGGRLAATLTARELQDRLAERGVMRLRLDRRPPGLLESVRALAPETATVGDELIVPGGASLRPAVLDVVRSAGAEIRGLTAEEGRLDTLYQELVAGPGGAR